MELSPRFLGSPKRYFSANSNSFRLPQKAVHGVQFLDAKVFSLFIVACLVFVIGACDLPQDESDVPIEEWTVTKVEYSLTTNPRWFHVFVTGNGNSLGDYEYYKDFDRRVQINPSALISITGLSLYDNYGFWNNGFTVYTQNTDALQAGTEAAFFQDWFYQAETNALFDTKVIAKIRIITPKKEVTILP